jgi:hypothetical protein
MLDATPEERNKVCQDALVYILDIACNDGITSEQRYKIIEEVVRIESASWYAGYEAAKELYGK